MADGWGGLMADEKGYLTAVSWVALLETYTVARMALHSAFQPVAGKARNEAVGMAT
jgi:hypothetical protein